MKPNNEILNELLLISPSLARIGNNNIFSVPEGYFSSFPLNTIRELHGSSFSVPDSYFDKFSDRILQKIKETADESETTGLLKKIRHTNVFTVPENYFDNFSQSVFSEVQPAKVIRMEHRSIWKYAAAAVITGLIGISSFWSLNTKSSAPSDNFTVADIKLPAYINQSFQYKTESDVNEAIENLSGEEIITYLQTTATASDNETLKSSINSNELPEQTDYLNDENTLETYLNKIKSSSEKSEE
ncbi:hypothetical protein BH09BAC2_BH09BAC2_06430 [soil metagenome]